MIWYFSLVLKARQLGITTFFCILYLDAVLFKSNQTAGIIAHTENDAKRIFKDKVKFPFDNLPSWIKGELEIRTDSTAELSFKNGSSIFVSVSTRSGTVQYLHISEFGYTCRKYPEKAEEIVTGAINSVEKGQIVSIESTAKGRLGYFFDFCQEAIRNQKSGKRLNELEFKFIFFPWWQNEEYQLDSNEILPQELVDYFNKLEREESIFLTNQQQQWYYAKRKTQQDNMFSEYPSTADEAFLSSIQGSYYQKQIQQAISDNRVANVPHEVKLPVDVWWDLGRNDYNVLLFTQSVGKEIRFIDLYYNRGEGLSHYVALLQKKRDELGYVYNFHYLPWDVEIKELSTNKSRLETLSSLGVTGIIVVPKLSIQEGIEMTRGIFKRLWFDKQKCAKLVESIINYRQEWDDRLGISKDNPMHDESSHFCDALRSVGVMIKDIVDVPESTEDKLYEKYGIFPKVG